MAVTREDFEAIILECNVALEAHDYEEAWNCLARAEVLAGVLPIDIRQGTSSMRWAEMRLANAKVAIQTAQANSTKSKRVMWTEGRPL